MDLCIEDDDENEIGRVFVSVLCEPVKASIYIRDSVNWNDSIINTRKDGKEVR